MAGTRSGKKQGCYVTLLGEGRSVVTILHVSKKVYAKPMEDFKVKECNGVSVIHP